MSTPPAAASGAVTIRGLTPELKARLRVRAAHNARSMEAEARAILEAALVALEEDPMDLATFARGLFAPLGGAELALPLREPARDPPGFGAVELEPPVGSAAPRAGEPEPRAPAGKASPDPDGRPRG